MPTNVYLFSNSPDLVVPMHFWNVQCQSRQGANPSVVSIPIMFLGLFTSSIQALIFSTLAAAYIELEKDGLGGLN